MECPGYSILIIAEESMRIQNIRMALERDIDYEVRHCGPDEKCADILLQEDRPDMILMMARQAPRIFFKNWLIQQAEKEHIPVILLCEEILEKTDKLQITQDLQYLYDDTTAQVQTIVLTLKIHIRFLARQALAERSNTAKHNNSEREAKMVQAAVRAPAHFPDSKLIAIGASMGGVEAVSRMVTILPERMPGIVMVQHLPQNFTDMYAKRLNTSCALKAVQAENGQHISEGVIYIAPGGHHMRVEKDPLGGYVIKIVDGERVTGHKPSVDVLFESIAKCAGKDAMGVILTGMGNDGAFGLLKMRQAGAYTVGQNEQSSLVYGMPKVAYEIGAVCRQADLMEVPKLMEEYAYRK